MVDAHRMSAIGSPRPTTIVGGCFQPQSSSSNSFAQTEPSLDAFTYSASTVRKPDRLHRNNTGAGEFSYAADLKGRFRKATRHKSSSDKLFLRSIYPNCASDSWSEPKYDSY